MEPRITILTLRVEDLDAATRYYTEGLGWEPILAVPGEVTFVQVAPGLALSLFAAHGYDTDAGKPLPAPFTLAHNVDSEDSVRAVVAEMAAAGGTVVKEPQRASWGGFHAFVVDPTGIPWEVAYNAGWHVADDGTITLGPVDG